MSEFSNEAVNAFLTAQTITKSSTYLTLNEFKMILHQRLGDIGNIQITYDSDRLAFNVLWRLFSSQCLVSIPILDFRLQGNETVLRNIETSFREQSKR